MKMPWMAWPEAPSDGNLDIHGDVASLTALEGSESIAQRRMSARKDTSQSPERSIAAARSVL